MLGPLCSRRGGYAGEGSGVIASAHRKQVCKRCYDDRGCPAEAEPSVLAQPQPSRKTVFTQNNPVTPPP